MLRTFRVQSGDQVMNRKRLLLAKVVVVCFSLLPLASLWAQSKPSEASAVPALPADIPANAERYSVTIMGNRAGQQAVWTAPDGTTHMFYQFNDRGRGPKTTSILTLDAKGVPVAETVNGNDYLKSSVNEDYALKAGTARWKNDSEQGEKEITESAVYASINGAPAEFATLTHAALINGGKIALLPEGEARVERVAERDVENSGQKKHVAMYAVTGLDFSPTYIWLDDRDHFFAFVNPWSTLVPEGWEKNCGRPQRRPGPDFAGSLGGTRQQIGASPTERNRFLTTPMSSTRSLERSSKTGM